VKALTVLMAARNAEATLREAIDSVLAQSFDDFDLVVVDDGSDDRTPEILASYGDERLTVLRNDRSVGLAASLNRGLSRCEGRYVARQDADDRSRPDRFARQVQFLDTHAQVALVGSWYRTIDDAGSVLGELELPADATSLRWHLLYYCPFVHSAVTARSETLTEAGGFDESFAYASDYDLWSRIARRSFVANIPDYLVDYRLSPTSMTETFGAAVTDEPRRIARAYLADLYGPATAPDPDFLETISALLFRPHLLAQTDDVRASARAALRHHAAFCSYYDLPQRRRINSALALRWRLATRVTRRALGLFSPSAASRADG
jgi:glycosyltransferase involved in cell wall biosynthesis